MPLRKRRLFSFENMTLVFAMISIGLNIIFAIVKIVFSFIISNYFFLISGIFTACLILAKFVCVKGIKENNKKFKTKNLIISIIVLLAGIIYIVYSLRLILYKDYNLYNYPMYMGILISLIASTASADSNILFNFSSIIYLPYSFFNFITTCLLGSSPTLSV